MAVGNLIVQGMVEGNCMHLVVREDKFTYTVFGKTLSYHSMLLS